MGPTFVFGLVFMEFISFSNAIGDCKFSANQLQKDQTASLILPASTTLLERNDLQSDIVSPSQKEINFHIQRPMYKHALYNYKNILPFGQHYNYYQQQQPHKFSSLNSIFQEHGRKEGNIIQEPFFRKIPPLVSQTAEAATLNSPLLSVASAFETQKSFQSAAMDHNSVEQLPIMPSDQFNFGPDLSRFKVYQAVPDDGFY